jgi:periplasmic protein CpxP/Spy
MKRTLTLLVLAGLTIALAACGGRRHHKHHGEMTDAQLEERIHEKLDDKLDDIDASKAQRAKIRDIVDARVLPEIKTLRPLKKETREVLMTELLSGKPNGATLHKLVNERSGTLTAFAHTMADAALDAHGELTSEQRNDIADRMREHAEDREDDAGDREWMAEMMVGRALDKLDATSAQEELVLDHKERLTTEFKTLRTKRDKNRATLEAQLRSDKPDAALIHRLIDTRSAEFTALAHKVMDGAVEIGATLTPEQRDLIRKKIERHRK